MILSSIFILSGVGFSFIQFEYNRSSYTGIVYDVKDNYYLINCIGERLYVYEKNHEHEIGDIISIEGYKQPFYTPILESSFDFNQYLHKRGIKNELVYKKIETRFSNPIRLKKYQDKFLENFDDETKQLVGAILFSESGDSDIQDDIKELHLSRLISASGIYIYAFIKGIEFLLSFKIKRKWTRLLSLFILSFYLVFTFPRFTVLRILFMSLLRWINEYVLKKRFNKLEIIGIGGLLFLSLNHFLAYQDSFILGFFIPITTYFVSHITRKKKRKFLYDTLLIYLLFIPFELKYYRCLNLLSIPLQLILSPIFIFFGFTSLTSFFGLPIYPFISIVGQITRNIIHLFSYISFTINCPPFHSFIVFIYYFVYFAFIYYWSIGFKPIKKYLMVMELSLIVCNIIPFKNMISNEVIFINVGQGDALLIRNHLNTILIDTGGSLYNDIANNVLIPFFKKERLYKIDLLITTHDDFDHKGAMEELVRNFKVKKYISDYQDFPIDINGLEIRNYNQHIGQDEDENNNSLVLGFNIANRDYLVMGDAPKNIEKYIMSEYSSIPCDILKIGHHGSDTSTSDMFIKYLMPKEAIISVGRNNYGHPSSSVLRILKNNNVKIIRTDEKGSIRYIQYGFS